MIGKKKGGNAAAWPDSTPGEPVAPAFLTHVDGGTLDFEMTLSLLGAYGIPTLTQYPREGVIGQVIAGFPGGGLDIYVPETLLDEARDILAADAVEDGDD
ncbi:MAG: hypothetical protein LBJ99_04915 [Oscillospiraceae bacterium]|nr:hypothetical protein [Oscillospiraceae bacterium]